MNEQDKKLVFRYLSMALPYNVMVDRLGNVKPLESCKITKNGTMAVETNDYPYTSRTYLVEEVKPYLRSMEDMTEEEMDEVEKILGNENIFDFMANGDIVLRKGCFNQKQLVELHNFFCSIHVDDCGLIEKGLAEKVTKDNNPYKNESN